MTNPKDPQAELLKDLKQLITGSEFQDYLYSDPNECVDAILALFQAHQQESKTSPIQIREALPCPHGRLPIDGVDGWKHCPHCLGVNNQAPVSDLQPWQERRHT